MGKTVVQAATQQRRAFGAARLRFAIALALAAATFIVAASAGAAPAGSVSAREAGTLSLNETGHLHLTSHHGFTLNEQGSTSGTISGTIYLHLNVVSTNRVTAEISIYPSGSSI